LAAGWRAGPMPPPDAVARGVGRPIREPSEVQDRWAGVKLPPPNLSKLDPGSPKDGFNAVIETPRGSPNKYAYDPDTGVFRLKTVLPAGAIFPYDFGFLPRTLAEDGDPLDVLVLLDASVPMGCVVGVRLIGVIEAIQVEKKGAHRGKNKGIRNDRLIAVAAHAHSREQVKRLSDLPVQVLDEIEAFFGFYNHAHGKLFKPVERRGPNTAYRLFKAAAARHRR
jgi:inorganic pyrophosphatase